MLPIAGPQPSPTAVFEGNAETVLFGSTAAAIHEDAAGSEGEMIRRPAATSFLGGSP
jgi:hypothetical protein